MTYILAILLVGPLAATGIYNPQVVRHHHCIAELGTFDALRVTPLWRGEGRLGVKGEPRLRTPHSEGRRHPKDQPQAAIQR